MTLWLRAIPFLWSAWLIYWWWSAQDVKANARVESRAARLSHGIPILVAVILLSAPHMSILGLDMRFVPNAPFLHWLAPLLVVTGLVFTVWARRSLGRNWSGTVTVKQEHELVTSGPYQFVRHPIYTGLLVAFAGSALAVGEWRGILAVLMIGLAFWRKLTLEERWMTETFGATYTDYRRKVRALIPFVL
ncbi:methyltransferase family protein [Methylovirgula sp. 4M-Z18]|uniref:methyltransferase family protein n=1 Tax=Methylovirgula sp. 4M-Z18 TaxID=2293567 RepID=UPI000E2ECF5E|nr:isoprenylcysteine carboxylmethyltransferase family protein [Methylovirgula sp. 4M-Z18]RFB81028.1 isoprenylcysteine carboxylmethyltransferase family protein [Methylovirgula sp. 4M-Z18]